MIKAVIFDYGGVMKKSSQFFKDVVKIFNVSREEIKLVEDKISEAGRMAVKGLIKDSQYFEEIAKILGRPLPNGYMELAKKHYRDDLVVFTEIIDLVKKLKTQGIKTAVLSNIGKYSSDLAREENLYDGFDEVVLSYEVGMRKPEPEIYILTAKRLNLKPEECLFVDDAEENLAPAKELGMKTILFKNPKQAVEEVLEIVKK